MKLFLPVRCPYCSGSMVYRITSRSLVCESCSVKLSPGELEKAAASKIRHDNHHDSASDNDVSPEDEALTGITGGFGSTAVCPACGGSLAVSGKPRPLSVCPECGVAAPWSASFLASGLPDIVLPFEKDKNAFLAALRNRARDKIFVPERFLRKLAKADLRAVYLPFWISNVDVSGAALYLGEKVRPHIGDKWIHEVYECHAEGARNYAAVPQNASRDISDQTARILEPFDFSKSCPFSPALLAGLYGGDCDRNARKCFKSTGERAAGSFENFLLQPENFQFLKIEKLVSSPVPAAMTYALLPFWIADVAWDDHPYRFVMNGQTGKLTGNYPVSHGRFVLCELSTWLLSGAGALELFGIYRHERGMLFLMLLLLFTATAGFFRVVSVRYLFFGKTASLISSAVMAGIAVFLIADAFWLFRSYPAVLVVFGLVCYLLAGMWCGIILAGSFVGADIPVIRRECDYCENKAGSVAGFRDNRLLYTRKHPNESLIGGRDGGPGRTPGRF